MRAAALAIFGADRWHRPAADRGSTDLSLPRVAPTRSAPAAVREARAFSKLAENPHRPTEILISGDRARIRLQRYRACAKPLGAMAPMQTSAGFFSSISEAISPAS